MLLIRYKEGQSHLINLVKTTTNKLYALLFVILCLFPSFANACFLDLCHLCIGYNLHAETYALPLSTTPSSGTNSYQEPRIGVHYHGCMGVVKVSGDFNLGVGDNPDHESFAFYGTMTLHPSACSNKPYCKNGGTPYQNSPKALADSVCTFYNNICSKPIPDSSGQTNTGSFLGMCGYKTSAPAWVEAIISNIEPFFKDVAGGILTILGGPIVGTVVAVKWHWDKLPYPIKGYELMNARYNNVDGGCMPVPIAPYPPPYGVPTGSLYIQSPRIQPICDTSHYVKGAFAPPVYVPNTSTKNICVEPQDSSKYSKFNKACMRVTFDNIVRTYSGDTTSSFISTTKQGNIAPAITSIPNPAPGQNNEVEAVYASGALSSCTEDSCHITPDDAQKFIPNAEVFNGNSSSQAKFAGYNLAAFTDLCYDFATSTGDSVTMSDIYGNQRTLQVVPGCSDPSINNGNSCGSNVQYTEQKICLHEPPSSGNGQGTYFGCVDRPPMETPQVSFCNQDNTSDSACININTAGGDSCSITHTLGNNGNYGTTNTCRTNYSIPIDAAMTDNCFNIPLPTKTFFKPYLKRTDSCATCPTVGPPNSKTQIGLYYDNNQLSYGASRICLFKLPQPLGKKVSKPYCPENCNTICTPFSPTGDGGLGLCYRQNPAPSVLSPLLPDQFCRPPAPPATGNPTVVTRPKLPIEDGLCVDVLMFDFADCNSPNIKNNQPYYNACKAFKTKCTTRCVGGTDSLHHQCVTGVSGKCVELMSLCMLPNLTQNCSNLKNQCGEGDATACASLNTSSCLLPNAYAYLDSCNQTFSQCIANKGTVSPSNNCYYIKKNKQFTPNTTPSPVPPNCPPNWVNNTPCKASGTFYYNSTPVSNPASANAVLCGNTKYCCNGNPASQSGGECPTHPSTTPQPSGMCPYVWSGPSVCSGEGYKPFVSFVDNNNNNTTSKTQATGVKCCTQFNTDGNCTQTKRVCCSTTQPGLAANGACPGNCSDIIIDQHSGWQQNGNKGTNWICNVNPALAFISLYNDNNSTSPSSPSQANSAQCCWELRSSGLCNTKQKFCCDGSYNQVHCPTINPAAQSS